MRTVLRKVLHPRFAIALMAGMVLSLSAAGPASAEVYSYRRGLEHIDPCSSSWEHQFQCDPGYSEAAIAWVSAYEKPGEVGWLGHASMVRFHPYGEHLEVEDNYTNGLYAWAEFVRYYDGGFQRRQIRSGYYEHRNYNWPENQYIKIRACQGTATRITGCGDWYWART